MIQTQCSSAMCFLSMRGIQLGRAVEEVVHVDSVALILIFFGQCHNIIAQAMFAVLFCSPCFSRYTVKYVVYLLHESHKHHSLNPHFIGFFLTVRKQAFDFTMR